MILNEVTDFFQSFFLLYVSYEIYHLLKIIYHAIVICKGMEKMATIVL